MLAVHVDVQVKPGTEAAFMVATEDNARHSLQEPGVVRFDLVQQREDATRFLLVEVYRDDAAPSQHKQTDHYARWRDVVEPMMAVPRSSVKYDTRFPPTPDGWTSA